MSFYNLITNVKAVQTIAAVNVNGGPNQAVDPWGGSDNPNSSPTVESFVATLTGVGNCSATIQIVGSNDGVSFVNAGPTFTVSGTSVDITPAVASYGLTQAFNIWGAYVTAISGTGATVNLTMNA